MKCPYCGVEFELFTDVDATHVDRLYNSKGDCWDEYCCKCPDCGKTLRAFEFFIFDGQSAEKMESE